MNRPAAVEQLVTTAVDDLATALGHDDPAGAEFPRAGFDAVRSSGLTALTVPAHLGGHGAGLGTVASTVTRVAAVDAAVGLVLAMHHLHTVDLFDGDPLPPSLAALAGRLTGPGGFVGGLVSEARSNAPHRGTRLTGRASRRAGGWVLDGRKTYVTGSLALLAARVTLTVDGNDDDRRAFLVPFDAPGVTIVPAWDTVGLRGSVGHDLVLSDVRLGDDHDLGPEAPPGPGARKATWWPILLAAVSQGIAAHALELVRGGAGVPSLRARPADDLELRHVLHGGEALMAYQTCRAVVDSAVARADARGAGRGEAGAAKVLAHRAATEVVDHVGRLVGTASVWRDHVWQRLYRDLRTGVHHSPPEDVVLGEQAAHLLHPGR